MQQNSNNKLTKHPAYSKKEEAEDYFADLNKALQFKKSRKIIQSLILKAMKGRKKLIKELEKQWEREKKLWLKALQEYEAILKHKYKEFLKHLHELSKLLINEIEILKERIKELDSLINILSNNIRQNAQAVVNTFKTRIASRERGAKSNKELKCIRKFKEEVEPLFIEYLNNGANLPVFLQKVKEIHENADPNDKATFKDIIRDVIYEGCNESKDVLFEIEKDSNLRSSYVAEKEICVAKIKISEVEVNRLRDFPRQISENANQNEMQGIADEVVVRQRDLERSRNEFRMLMGNIPKEGIAEISQSAKESVLASLSKFSSFVEIGAENKLSANATQPALNGQIKKEPRNDEKLNINNQKPQPSQDENAADDKPQPRRIRR